MFALCLQGGGVYIYSGTVSFLSCTITGNSATFVRAQLKTSHRPDGKMLTLLLDSRLHNCERCFGQLQAVRAVET